MDFFFGLLAILAFSVACSLQDVARVPFNAVTLTAAIAFIVAGIATTLAFTWGDD